MHALLLADGLGRPDREEAADMYYQMYQSGGEWRWRLKAANHETLASGEGYVNKADCKEAIRLLKSTTSETPVREI